MAVIFIFCSYKLSSTRISPWYCLHPLCSRNSPLSVHWMQSLFCDICHQPSPRPDPDLSLCYLCVGELEPWLLPIGKDLPQDNPKAPHITLCGELPVHDAFRRHPADGEHGVSSYLKRVKTEAQRVIKQTKSTRSLYLSYINAPSMHCILTWSCFR